MAINIESPYTKVISIATDTDVPRSYFGSFGATRKW